MEKMWQHQPPKINMHAYHCEEKLRSERFLTISYSSYFSFNWSDGEDLTGLTLLHEIIKQMCHLFDNFRTHSTRQKLVN